LAFRRMQLSFVVLLLVALPLPLLSAAQSPWTLESVLRQLDRQADGFRSMTADIERTKVTVVVNDHSTESGKIFVRRDGKMRIDLTSPDPRTILRDGDHLYVYNPKILRVEEYDLAKHRDLVDQLLLLGFGTSGKELQKGYLVTFQREETAGAERTIHLELIPKAEQVRSQINRIELWVDEATWLPARQVFYETGTGDYFIIRYTHVARNVPIPDARFKPRWPRGVTKVKPQG
jgi:outer membrane lipoprotein-sorting protein